MATTKGSEFDALVGLSNVVAAKPLGGRLSLKKQSKSDLTEVMVDRHLKGDFGVRTVKPKNKRNTTVVPPSQQDWGYRSHPEDYSLTVPEAPPSVADQSVVKQATFVPPAVALPGTPQAGHSRDDSDGSTLPGDSSGESDAHTYYDSLGAPWVLGPCDHLFYLKDNPDPPPSTVGGPSDKMEEDAPVGPRKRPAGKNSKSARKKIPKKPLMLESTPEPSVRTGPKIRTLAVHPDFYGRVPAFYAPDTPVIPARPVFQGEVPTTPPALLDPSGSFEVTQELLKIVADYKVPQELVDRLTAFGTVVERLISGRDRIVQDIDARLRALETSLSDRGSVTFAQALRSPPVSAVPAPPVVPPVVPKSFSLQGSSAVPDGSWFTVTKKGRTTAQHPTVAQESIRPPPVGPRPPRPVAVPPPRPDLPAIVVKPMGTDITTSAALKGLLEAKLSPQTIGVRVLSCQPAAGNGVLVRVETQVMADKLVQAVNGHLELQGCCEARVPRKREPQILIYDIPAIPGDRQIVEEEFLDKLRASNSLPDGDLRVLFRRKGRGSQQHWVLSVAPSIFASLGSARRLHWGFGSFRYREYCEPLRCFKCYRFGHVRAQCTAPQELCSKCPGSHNFKDCPKDRPVCRNCRDYNARNRTAQRLPGNLGRSQVGTQELPHLDLPFRPDIYLVQEPYLVNGSIYGLPLSWRTVVATSGKVLLAVRNPNIALWVRRITDHVVAVDLTVGGDSVTVVTFYFPPSLSQTRLVRELEEVVALCPPPQLLLAGDANARSLLWGPDLPDHRAADASGPFVEFVLAQRLAVWNDPWSGPTFETERARGWIDVTLSSPQLFRRKGHWEVNDTLLSDHHPLLYVLEGSASVPPRCFPLNRRRLRQVADRISVFYATVSQELAHIDSQSHLDDWVDRLLAFLTTLSSTSGSFVRPCLRVPWWDAALAIQRKKTRALRARFQRCRHLEERSLRRTIYKRELARYKFLIKTKSRACFEKFCEQLTRLNPFQLPYKLAAGRIRSQPVLQRVCDPQGSWTSSAADTVRVIADQLFRPDDAAAETLAQRTVRREVMDYVAPDDAPPFSLTEIRGVISSLAKKKAPGLDGVTNELIQAVFVRCPELFLVLFNKCLQLSYFPRNWRTAKLVLLCKPGRDLSLPSSYRPICLLSGISKVLDKLVTRRLVFLFQSQGLLHDHQHGFRAGRSCETANHALWLELQSALRKRGRVALISLDVAGAFDTVWRQSVLRRLMEAQCPQNLFRLVQTYFDRRTVCYQFNDQSWSFPADRGVPQGSCSGPFYWNLVLDTVFRVDLPPECYIQAFADDLLLVVRGSSKTDIEVTAQIALDKLVDWAGMHKLSFNSAKTTLLPVTYGGRLSLADPPRVSLTGNAVQVVSNFRYLGVWWDSGLTFTVHFHKVRSRVDLLSYRISMVAERFYSRRGHLFLRVYRGALEPFILYGYGAWGHRLGLQRIRSSLNSIQRKPLLRLTRAYRTVSTVALQVLAGVLPMDLKAKGVFAKFLVSVAHLNARVGNVTFRSSDYLARFNPTEVHPLLWHSIPFSIQTPTGFDLELFTDGSKDADRVGSSLVVFYHGVEIHHEERRLSDHASVFQAEAHGLYMALVYITTLSSWDPIRIFSDSQSLLKALAGSIPGDTQIWELKALCQELRERRSVSLHWVRAHVGTLGNERADYYAKRAVLRPDVDVSVLRPLSLLRRQIGQVLLTQWQDRWSYGENGRLTAEFFPTVGLVPRLFNSRIVQLLTGHGRFPAYFYRFALSDTDVCICGGTGTVLHYLRTCPLTLDLYSRLQYDPSRLFTLLSSPDNLSILDKLVSRVVGWTPNL
ncbi:Retrovirus-related Pol polyprotein from type-1 retrotransposable element R1 [Araneus ventricosus]|uniref:Retrovirus-related Pol polyprotein from type-1 retrotransposable element R1 n=1 Tax=Araneus ventricosus TaxID=182803 RepID=A0A4Y2KXT2_ARAVE|nr:Retrovirus-related Pol polyprotein from type-1 retrotransposable element R1 [Araneus ventricosus]